MDWRTLLLGILKGVLAFLADEFDPPSRRAPKKEAPQPPKAEEPMHSAGWAPPTEPEAVNLIVVETDAGSTVAAASFIGGECVGTKRVERERRPGESRRARRGAHTITEQETANREFLMAPRHPRMIEFAQQVRDHANAEYIRQQEAVVTVKRTRRPGLPLSVSQLTPVTVAWIEVGEPLKYAPRAA